MQKSILKITIMIMLIGSILIMLLAFPVFATEDAITGEETVEAQSDSLSEQDETSEVNDESLEENTEDVNSTENEDAEQSTETIGASTTPTSSNDTIPTKKINSYSTISTLPEANLGLNNILNVILIAIGVIIILLAIAILIRLK